MNAVLDLVWKGSYGQTSVDTICDQAGVKKGSFYHFFESKSDLMAGALMASWEHVYRPQMDALFSPSRPPLERIQGYLAHGYAVQREKQKESGRVVGCPLFSLGDELSMQEQRLREVVQSLLCTTVRYLETALRDGHSDGTFYCPDASAMAHTVFRICEGTLTEARIMNDLSLLQGLETTILGLLRAKTAMSELHAA